MVDTLFRSSKDFLSKQFKPDICFPRGNITSCFMTTSTYEISFQVLKIVPNEGTVLPYSVQRVHVGFHGFERLRIKAIIVCEIFRGPTERIHLLARADAIRYAIDTNVIDFGQQVFIYLTV